MCSAKRIAIFNISNLKNVYCSSKNEGLNHIDDMRVFTSYNPTDYWIHQGRTYKERFNYNKEFRLQEQMLSSYLKNVSPKFKSVLEIGCGFGRITKLILSNHPDVQKYLAIDLSPHQICNARQYVRSGIDIKKRRDIDLSFVVSDIQSLVLSEKYDLVLAVEVLLHILPSEIKEVIIKLVNLSKMHTINVDYYEENMTRLAPHNFLHEYQKIYNEIPSVVEVNRIAIKKSGLFAVNTRQFIFHATKAKIMTKS
ncbi:MAG TPA: class I SAM-dependent methyltransferase [Nitrososphaeraceae archaeon]